jgi:murein DD-endopeptidase MepM/ murein hydrolase activator NlpD
VVVRVGQMVASGQSLGLGGNTGVNARKKNHGTHVHIEIHDAEKGAWSSYRIRDLLLSIQ